MTESSENRHAVQRKMLEYWVYHTLAGKPNKDTYAAMLEMVDDGREERLDRFAYAYLNRQAAESFKVLTRHIVESDGDGSGKD